MYYKFICVVIFTLVSLKSLDAKRLRKKQVNTEIEESTPQPSVLTYSTFGFNDVGSYDGFIPSSPDYANYLTNHNKDTSSRIYAPAFPSSPESSFLTDYDTQAQPEQQMSTNNFQPATIHFFTSPNSDFRSQNEYGTSENDFVQNGEGSNSPAYGAKIPSKTRNKPYNDFNRTNVNVFGSVSPIIAAETIEKNPLEHDSPDSHEVKIAFEESSINNPNILKQASNPQFEEYNNSYLKTPTTVNHNPYKFPKVIDFTSQKENYPTSISNKYLENTQTSVGFDTFPDTNDDVRSTYKHFRGIQPYKGKNSHDDNNHNKITYEKDSPKTSFTQYQDSSDNSVHIGNNLKNNKLDQEYKEKLKNVPWLYSNYIDDKKSKSTMKGYQYSTNHSSTSFKYDYGPQKTQFNSSVDELAPASSNQGFSSYQLPETHFPESNKITNIKSPYESNTNNIFSYDNPRKPFDEYPYQFKNSLPTIPTVSSHWGNIFKTTDHTQYPNHIWRPQNNEDGSEDIVHIPKRPPQAYVKQVEEFSNDWSNNYRPHKAAKPQLEWGDNLKTRFKSEEDLLGLRTHETSRPSYISSYRPINHDFAEEYEYKRLVDKWRQNYIKSKLKDSMREYESYASEHKPVHVPVPRPYPIEVPHPVIIPVPQPYPVKVPIPKPVAVPVIQELSVPIEKPVPYPVYKKVPYPIEKPVPVPVEKQVHVPVVKPYPVAIPQIRPIFHHTKHQDDDEIDSDEEYLPRPEKIPYPKKPKSTRNRARSPPPSRRPSRMTYQDRNKRRLPTRTASPSSDYKYSRRPFNKEYHGSPHKYRDDIEDDDFEPREYFLYCKRTGNC